MSDIHSYLNSISILIGFLGLLWLAAVKTTRIEVKVDIMWGMFLKRAVVEGVHKGVLEVNSPIRLINNSGEMLSHMADELRTFYEKNCQKCNEAETALKLEKEFGSRLAKEVCIPNGISFGICIIIAVAVAKNQQTLTEILDTNLPKSKPKK